jgi:ABC-2 type transport system ATP-binding protein
VTGQVLEVRDLSKWFGHTQAVDGVSFEVAPGRVTGFLGPNGAGKTTTLRCLLGLVAPSGGEVLIGGRRYRDLDRPLGTVGAVLESSSFHPGRSARNHLRFLAEALGVARARVDEVIAMVGMQEYADRRVGGYSLGMRQRLGLAQAMLGDPGVLVLDEPSNGLDPGGVAWLRGFLRALAAEGRTVLISSHVLGEVQQVADDIVLLARGRLVTRGSLLELEAAQGSVLVRSPERDRLAQALAASGPPGGPAGGPGGQVGLEPVGSDGLSVAGWTTDDVGRVAHREHVEVLELSRQAGALERLFLQLTGEAAVPAPAAFPPVPSPATGDAGPEGEVSA